MTVFLSDPDVTLYHGDAVEVLKTLPAESVHMCVTSPPFYGLRDYGTGRWEGGDPDCDHEQAKQKGRADYGFSEAAQLQTSNVSAGYSRYAAECPCGARRVDQQIGLEETPEQWVAALVDVFRGVRRVLRPEGTLWLEIGDSYASNGQRGDTRSGFNARYFGSGEPGKNETTAAELPINVVPAGCKPKDLIGAPWMLAFALRADGWYLRSDVVWARPNPMPESVTDRPTKSHSYVFLLAKRSRYFFDQEAVREPHTPDGRHKTVHDHLTDHSHPNYDNIGNGNERWPNSGRNVRSVWNIATQPYPEAHFATFPEELARRCILAGTSERGCCPECGAPWVREVEASYRQHPRNPNPIGRRDGQAAREGYRPNENKLRDVTTIGWAPSCTKFPTGDPVPCVVLDPFVGSGTVPYVARKHGRHAIGIDLNAEYLELAAKRLQQQSLFAEVR